MVSVGPAYRGTSKQTPSLQKRSFKGDYLKKANFLKEKRKKKFGEILRFFLGKTIPISANRGRSPNWHHDGKMWQEIFKFN